MDKQQLKEELAKKELIKPSKMEERLYREVEALCDGLDCGTYLLLRPAGDTGNQNDILV